MTTVTGLNVYPIKSGSGTALSSAEVTPLGFRHDREFMLIDSDGTMLTQRAHPRMALLDVGYDGRLLTVGDLVHRPVDDGPLIETSVWKDPVTAIDQGEEAATWFSAFLDLKCRLVRFTGHRPTGSGGQTAFADGYPVLVISQESLDDLNDRLAERGEDALPMNRFRPNLVLSGLGPFGEDGVRRIRIGEVELDVVKPCGRCVLTTVDQATGVKGREPLRTLAGYRAQVYEGDRQIMFGQNAVPRTTGTLHLGESVTVLA
ncbi:MOSC domain-containing protein [Actinocorallia longicatena]|uniref:MOSC domain-containing protein n=1 Tax=Actinocorallia longicatena TaxID=111803 RepID=A0ABP6QK05_9ACTN